MYDHPNPVFLDFETQSACDLPEEGSYRYAEHPSTRILILVMAIDEVFHVWLPSHTGVDCSSWGRLRMWPSELHPAHKLQFHTGNQCPSVVLEATSTRPVVSHNAYGFDKLIWDRCIGSKVCGWLDSMFLSRAAGLPGGLDALSKTILGKGKDRAKTLLPILTTARNSIYGDSFVYPHLPIGDIQAFTRYAIGDVELVRRLWPSFNDLEVEVDIIDVNNRINDRGIKLDVPLLKKIEDVAAYSVKMAGQEISKLTDGRLHEDNIRSTKQVHEWLATYGVAVTDDNGKPCLRKEIVQRYLDSPFIIQEHLSASKEIPPLVCDVLRTRMKALRITDAKVSRAQLRVNKDHRARGLLAYHAAGTGRKSSYGIQIHNLPRPHKYFNTKRMLEIYENDACNDPKNLYDKIQEELKTIQYAPGDERSPITTDDVSSGMIRPSLVPAGGHVFGICDYSQVEARCVAWMCDETTLLKGFAENKDVYKLMATILYNVPLEHVTDSMRQVCKVVILGCIAEGTPVLTDKGWKNIEDVQLTDLVWDGAEFVTHEGVVYKGEKECLNLNGVTLTGDHKVLTNQGWRAAEDVIAENIPLTPGTISETGQLYLNLSKTNAPITDANVTAATSETFFEKIWYPSAHKDVMNVQRSKRGTLSRTGTQWQTISTEKGYSTDCVQWYQDATQTPILVTDKEESKSISRGDLTPRASSSTSKHLKDGIIRHWTWIVSKMTDIMNQGMSNSQHEEKTSSIHAGVKRTYDILNCGPRHRFQAGSMIVHNCGYGMGVHKFRVYCANSGVDLTKAGVTAEQCIETYRNTYTKIAGWKPHRDKSFRVGGLWKDLENAIKSAVETGKESYAGKCTFSMHDKTLYARLPSGRTIRYPNCRVEDIIPPYVYTMGLPEVAKATVVYDSPRGLKSLYGGLATENMSQAICRDFMCEAEVKLERENLRPVLDVHDEVVCEFAENKAEESLKRQHQIMSECPQWSPGFPLACEAFLAPRFIKKPFKGWFKI